MARYNSSSGSTSINGAATISSPYQGAFTNLTGTPPYTVTLPNPTLFPGSNQTFYNSTNGTITLSAPSGNFVGTGASGTSTNTVFAGNVISVTSDGTNYIVISEDGSPLIATTGSFSSDVTITGASATVNIQPNSLTLYPGSIGAMDRVAIGVNNRSTGAFTTLAANAQVSFTANTTSSSTTTGSLVVTGGVGVSGTITASSVVATGLTGTLQTAAQANVTSLGTLTGLLLSGTLTSTSNAPFSLQSNGNTGTYTQTVIYNNQNNTSGNSANGVFIERGRVTESSSGEIRSFVIGSRGGEIQLILNKDGKLGVGISNPVAALHVKNNGASGSLSLSGVAANDTGGASYILMGNTDSAGVAGPSTIIAANRELYFGVGDNFAAASGGANTTYLKILAGGRLSHTPADGSNDVIAVDTSGSSPYMRFRTSGTNNGYVQFTTSDAYFWNDRANQGIKISSGQAGLSLYWSGAYRTVWHDALTPNTTQPGAGGADRTGSNPAPNARYLNGWGIEHFTVMQRNVSVSLSSGSLNTFYCLELSGEPWGSGVAEVDIRRTSVHQDSGGYGAFFGKIRYRSTAWGHHRDFWEIDENWGSGSYYPMLAATRGHPYASYNYIWLRGGLTYYFNFNSSDYIIQNPVASNLSLSYAQSTFPTLGNSKSSTEIPDQARYYQQHLCSQGYNLGQASYRWNALYLSNAPDVSSDRRLKENFDDALGLDFLMLLKPCSFTMLDLRKVKDDPNIKWDQRRRQGLIAQEVKEVMDQLGIATDDFIGYNDENPEHLSLVYEQFIPVLIKSVQQQQTLIQDLLNRIEKLESK